MLAQSILGTIRGSLFDDEGAPLQGAAIRVVDEATGIERLAHTTASGDYEVPNLRAGTYRVEDASAGFSAFQRTDVVLSAGDTVRVDIVLSLVILRPEAGGVAREPVPVRAEELVVTGDGGSNIQLESPAVQVGLDQQQLSTLPRNSLDIQDYLFLTPSVVGAGETFGRYLSGQGSGAYLLLDGQPSSSVLTGIPPRTGAGLYAVDEVKVLSNSQGAEYGGLATVVVTTRRGGNQLSGGAFYDFGADELNALTYTEKSSDRERGYEGSDTQDHRYAVWLGGPIREQKTFFFLNYEGFRASSVGGGRVANVPTEKMRRGDFSELLPRRTLVDPDTELPFPGNVIPPERIDPAGLAILERFYPLPNRPTLAAPWTYQEFVNVKSDNNRVDARVDHELSPSDSVFARFTWQDGNPGPFFLTPLLPRLGTRPGDTGSHTLATSWMRIFSSTLLNELRGGWSQRSSTRQTAFVVGEVADELGIEVPTAARSLPGFPAFTFADRIAADIAEIPDASPGGGNREESTLTVSDTFTWLLGRHSLKLGGLYLRNRIEDQFSLEVNGLSGRIVFDGDNPASSGSAVADLLLGRPAQSVEGISTRGGHPFDASSQLFAGFIQDDWKLSKRLTLFLGLRYEVELGFRERNHLLANLDPEGRRVVVPDASVAPLVINSLLPVVTAAEAGVDRALVNADTDNWSPRLGFAYRLDEDKTVLRGGAGVFYPTSTAAASRELLSRSAFQATSIRRQPPLRQAFSGRSEAPSLPVVHAIPFDLERPRFLQYHVTLERELPGDFGLRASFLGAHAQDLLISRLINTLPASTVSFDPVGNAADRARLPFPELAPTVRKLESGGHSDFKALQLEAARRWRAGLALHLAYTLSRTHGDAPGFDGSTLGAVQYDPYDLSKNLGPDPYIPRHRFVMDATWDVPVGRGRAVDGLTGWLDALLGGWTVSTIVQARSGVFLTPFFTGDSERANIGTVLTNSNLAEAWRPDLVGDPSGSRDRNNFFNLGAFGLPAAGTIGNAPAGVIEGPGGWVVNLGFYKEVVAIDSFVAQLRVTLDNAFNQPQFYVDPASRGFLNLSDYLEGTINRTTNVLGSSGVGNPDGFAVGRVVRVGLHVRF